MDALAAMFRYPLYPQIQHHRYPQYLQSFQMQTAIQAAMQTSFQNRYTSESQLAHRQNQGEPGACLCHWEIPIGHIPQCIHGQRERQHSQLTALQGRSWNPEVLRMAEVVAQEFLRQTPGPVAYGAGHAIQPYPRMNISAIGARGYGGYGYGYPMQYYPHAATRLKDWIVFRQNGVQERLDQPHTGSEQNKAKRVSTASRRISVCR